MPRSRTPVVLNAPLIPSLPGMVVEGDSISFAVMFETPMVAREKNEIEYEKK